ncbi:MAG: hypothetical protein ACXW32_03860 [Limisphaerales bacterium]
MEATITTEQYRTDSSAPYLKERGTFRLTQSNEWWEVEVDYGNPGKNQLKIENAKKIPGGTRSYHLFHGHQSSELTTAAACPVSYPSQNMLFEGWLSFSANPELPVIDETRMRRILNLPVCDMDLVNAPENVGFYRIQHLGSEKRFVSFLQITNSGYVLDVEVLGDGELGKSIRQVGAPFLEYERAVLATTNIGTWKFPLHVRSKSFGFTWKEGKRVKVLTRQTEIKLLRASFNPADRAQFSIIESLYALDRRAPGSTGDGAGYIVKDDEWKALNR